jgi:Ser/Thr protein kinase RdoA (MazF antagonist)
MLKLKYLFSNVDLAQMLLNNWEHDKDYPEFLKFFRISANAIYWCSNCGNTFFLRFAPGEEKPRDQILAELDFLSYLRSKGYPAAETILSKCGKELETAATPWGPYHAVAFKKAPGKPINQVPMTDDIIYGWGRSLGILHKLSSEYRPVNNIRKDWKQTMDWMDAVLSEFPEETAAKNELDVVKALLSKLPVSKENFGLIHYDFETDNVFYNETDKTFNPIDFDDAVYHWYAMDIEQALDSMKEELEVDKIETAVNSFIQGYRSEFDIYDAMLELLPLFRRYGDLYSYVRVLRSLKEKWNHEPEWMVDLRAKLEDFLKRRKCGFGKEA